MVHSTRLLCGGMDSIKLVLPIVWICCVVVPMTRTRQEVQEEDRIGPGGDTCACFLQKCSLGTSASIASCASRTSRGNDDNDSNSLDNNHNNHNNHNDNNKNGTHVT
jgi:hypothetical protein